MVFFNLHGENVNLMFLLNVESGSFYYILSSKFRTSRQFKTLLSWLYVSAITCIRLTFTSRNLFTFLQTTNSLLSWSFSTSSRNIFSENFLTKTYRLSYTLRDSHAFRSVISYSRISSQMFLNFIIFSHIFQLLKQF